MGSTATPVLEQRGSPSLDKIPPVGHIKRSYIKQHIIRHTKIYNMVQPTQMKHQEIQQQSPRISLAHPSRISLYICTSLVPDFGGRFCPIFGQAEEEFFYTNVRSLFDEKNSNKFYICLCVQILNWLFCLLFKLLMVYILISTF